MLELVEMVGMVMMVMMVMVMMVETRPYLLGSYSLSLPPCRFSWARGSRTTFLGEPCAAFARGDTWDL